MKKTISEIIAEIRSLLDELEGVLVGTSLLRSGDITQKPAKKVVGCIGAIQDLINEKFFETQKGIFQVVDKLKEEGQPYSRELVSMNLLNLVKRKILRRIKENDLWQYILRK